MPFNLRFAELTTALGVQGGHQELTAPSPDDPGSPSTACGTRTATSELPATCSTSSSSATRTKAQIAGRIEQCRLERLGAGSSSTTRHSIVRIAAQPQLHAEERQRRLDPELALGPRRQHHRAICRARAEARGAVLARRARRHRDLRHRQSEPQDRDRQVDRGRPCGGPWGRSASRPRPTTRSSTASSSAG